MDVGKIDLLFYEWTAPPVLWDSGSFNTSKEFESENKSKGSFNISLESLCFHDAVLVMAFIQWEQQQKFIFYEVYFSI